MRIIKLTSSGYGYGESDIKYGGDSGLQMLISSKNKFGMVKWRRSGSAGLFNCGILKFKISNLE